MVVQPKVDPRKLSSLRRQKVWGSGAALLHGVPVQHPHAQGPRRERVEEDDKEPAEGAEEEVHRDGRQRPRVGEGAGEGTEDLRETGEEGNKVEGEGGVQGSEGGGKEATGGREGRAETG